MKKNYTRECERESSGLFYETGRIDHIYIGEVERIHFYERFIQNCIYNTSQTFYKLIDTMHNITTLPDKRTYETFDSEAERNRRYNELKNKKTKVEHGSYDSMNGKVYFIIYKE